MHDGNSPPKAERAVFLPDGYEAKCKLKRPDQIDGKEVGRGVVVLTLEGSIEGAAILVDFCLKRQN